LKIHPSIYRNYQSLQIFCPILTSLSLNLMAVVANPGIKRITTQSGMTPCKSNHVIPVLDNSFYPEGTSKRVSFQYWNLGIF
ncbi:MAG: hypothetical protein ACEY3K_06470, partial [Wolbachia sp.]